MPAESTAIAVLRVMRQAEAEDDIVTWPLLARRLRASGVPTNPPGRRWTARRVRRFLLGIARRGLSEAEAAELGSPDETMKAFRKAGGSEAEAVKIFRRYGRTEAEAVAAFRKSTAG